jgi:hypothetical protein
MNVQEEYRETRGENEREGESERVSERASVGWRGGGCRDLE